MPDEHFYSTLARISRIDDQGQVKQDPNMNTTFHGFPRFTMWLNAGFKCRGEFIRRICNLALADLPTIWVQHNSLVANKFNPQVDPRASICHWKHLVYWLVKLVLKNLFKFLFFIIIGSCSSGAENQFVVLHWRRFISLSLTWPSSVKALRRCCCRRRSGSWRASCWASVSRWRRRCCRILACSRFRAWTSDTISGLWVCCREGPGSSFSKSPKVLFLFCLSGHVVNSVDNVKSQPSTAINCPKAADQLVLGLFWAYVDQT